jgi:hypothetical protein
MKLIPFASISVFSASDIKDLLLSADKLTAGRGVRALEVPRPRLCVGMRFEQPMPTQSGYMATVRRLTPTALIRRPAAESAAPPERRNSAAI